MARTVFTLTLTGTATNHASANDIANLTVTFGDDAFTNEGAATVGNSAKNDIAVSFTDASGIAYTGTLAETAANNGAVGGEIVATLSGDTFTAAVVSGNHVSATNVPGGLTASFARTSATKVTLTLTGTATNHAAAHGINNLGISFGNGAFTNETAATVTGSTKSDLAITYRDPSSIAYSGTFAEADNNDGSVNGNVVATLTGDTFAAGTGTGGTTAAGVSATNVPDGLTAVLTRTSDTKVTLTLTGTATNHADTNSISNLTITFTDAAFVNEGAATVGGSTKSDIAVTFRRVAVGTPTVSSIVFANSGSGGTYDLGETITVNVGFDEGSLTIDTMNGTPRVALTVGSATRYATMTGELDFSTQTIVDFAYTVQGGDLDTDGVDIAANALELNGATIQDADSNDADLAHAAVAGGTTRKVDGGPVTVTYAGTPRRGGRQRRVGDGQGDGDAVRRHVRAGVLRHDGGGGVGEQRADGADGGADAHQRHGGDPDAHRHGDQPRRQRQHHQPRDRLHRQRLRHRVGVDGVRLVEVRPRGHLQGPVHGDLRRGLQRGRGQQRCGDGPGDGDARRRHVHRRRGVGQPRHRQQRAGGLTASFTRDSDTKVTLRLTGTATSHANSDDVNDLTITFTDDAFAKEAAATVAGATKSDLVVNFTDASAVTWAGSFEEVGGNDGSVGGQVTATLSGDTFATDVVSANHVSASNVPSGLAASFTRTSDTVVTLMLTGNAASHEDSDDVSDLTVTFVDDAFVLESASTVAGSSKNDLVVDFRRLPLGTPAVSFIGFGNAPASGGTYALGETIEVGVQFDESGITVTGGTPRVALTVGSATRYATYTEAIDFEASQLTAVSFAYTVQGGDSDTDGVGIPANGLELNGATIRDEDSTDADLVHAAVAGGASRKVDGGPANRAPSFTSPAAFDVAENTTAVGTVSAEDADTGDDVADYTLGGTDAARFSLAADGTLAFAAAPDFENPTDVGGNNVYDLTVTATSGTGDRELSATQTVAVTVTDADEPPGQPAAPTVGSPTANSLRVSWSAPSNTGPPITDYDVQRLGGDDVSWQDWPHAGTALQTTITGLEANTAYLVRVRATNAEGMGEWSDTTQDTTGTNRAPTAPAVSDRTVRADAAFRYSFAASTDPEGQRITYSATLVDDMGALVGDGSLPSWLTFDAAARAFSGTPPASNTAASWLIRVTATDNGTPPASASATFTLTAEASNTAPTADAGADQTTAEGALRDPLRLGQRSRGRDADLRLDPGLGVGGDARGRRHRGGDLHGAVRAGRRRDAGLHPDGDGRRRGSPAATRWRFR